MILLGPEHPPSRGTSHYLLYEMMRGWALFRSATTLIESLALSVGKLPAEELVHHKLHVEHVHRAVSVDVGAPHDPRICFGPQENINRELNV